MYTVACRTGAEIEGGLKIETGVAMALKSTQVQSIIITLYQGLIDRRRLERHVTTYMHCVSIKIQMVGPDML